MHSFLKCSIPLLLLTSFSACKQPPAPAAPGWKEEFKAAMPLMGHRNWIVVADQAFPAQNTPGITYINTNENLAPVLEEVINAVKASGYIKPVFYQDKELAFITEDAAPGVATLSAKVLKLMEGAPVQSMLHDSVFTRLDAAATQFRVLVLKTNERIPYSSVLLQLDCAYWSAEKEAALRAKMAVAK